LVRDTRVAGAGTLVIWLRGLLRPPPELDTTPRSGWSVYTRRQVIYTERMSKHLVDIDEEALISARVKLGTETIKDTVNGALRRAGANHISDVRERLDVLAQAELLAREEAWR
jgi:Arc/MetJ family transcription regulator